MDDVTVMAPSCTMKHHIRINHHDRRHAIQKQINDKYPQSGVTSGDDSYMDLPVTVYLSARHQSIVVKVREDATA